MSFADAYLDTDAFFAPSESEPLVSASLLTARRQWRLLELMLGAIDTQGLLISAVTSVVNHLTQERDGYLSQDALIAYLPAEPTQSLALGPELIASTLPSAHLVELQEFHARLAIARSMTLSFSRYPAEFISHKGGVHIEVLSGVWRDLCEHTVVLIDALRSAVPDHSRRPRSAMRSLSLLSSCANGDAPCVMDDGTIEIKGWVERRRHSRWTVAWPVSVFDVHNTVPALITNISLGGFGLFATEALQASDHICVTLQTGQRLTGEVVWIRGGHHGLKFPTPLSSTDPLIAKARSETDCA